MNFTFFAILLICGSAIALFGDLRFGTLVLLITAALRCVCNTGGMIPKDKTEVFLGKPLPVPLCSTQIPMIDIGVLWTDYLLSYTER